MRVALQVWTAQKSGFYVHILSLKKNFFKISCTLVSCLNVHVRVLEPLELETQELELQRVMNCHVGAGN